MGKETPLKNSDNENGIFRDVNEIIDGALKLTKGKSPKFSHKAASDELSKGPINNVGAELVEKVFQKVEENWKRSPRASKPSEKLWVPRRTLEWSEKFESAEVPLERSAVALFKFYNVLHKRIDGHPNPHLTWFNQVPVASGIVSQRQSRNAIDLVCRTGEGVYDFVELKYPKRGETSDKRRALSEMPLNAAMEILKNGLLYLFTRKHLDDLVKLQQYEPKLDETEKDHDVEATEILKATKIALCVLAPAYFYNGFDLAWLEGELNEGLAQFFANYGGDRIAMTFRFESLVDEPFKITEGNGFKLDFTRRHPVLWKVAGDKSS